VGLPRGGEGAREGVDGVVVPGMDRTDAMECVDQPGLVRRELVGRPGALLDRDTLGRGHDGRNWRSAGGKQRVSSSHQANAEYAASRATPSVSTISTSSAAKSANAFAFSSPKASRSGPLTRGDVRGSGPVWIATLIRPPVEGAGRTWRAGPSEESSKRGNHRPKVGMRDSDPSQNSPASANPAAAQEPANRSRCNARPRTLPPATRNESATSKAFTRPCRS